LSFDILNTIPSAARGLRRRPIGLIAEIARRRPT
jgi:hypothetical protein